MKKQFAGIMVEGTNKNDVEEKGYIIVNIYPQENGIVNLHFDSGEKKVKIDMWSENFNTSEEFQAYLEKLQSYQKEINNIEDYINEYYKGLESFF